jgi:NAD(P)-dependent dehydrogenase (short-subunit alcohol dehydrogenase family)
MQRITTPFGFHSTAAEAAAGLDLSGKRVIVTGGAAGLGAETARVLANVGAAVTLAVRRPEIAQAFAEELRAVTRTDAVEVRSLDLADLSSVRSLAEQWSGPLHILINNAGIMAVPNLQRSPQGREIQFATNYLGHFALATWLRPALAAARGARVVSLSSSGHLFSPVVLEDIDFEFTPYDPIVAYGRSKSATALLSVGITNRWGGDGVTSNTLNPGAIATGLQKHTGGLKTPVERRKTVEQGAATAVLLAASPLLEGVGGRYFEDCNEADEVPKRPADLAGYARYALDPELAERLWTVSERLIR